VSVIIPTYNRKNSVLRALASLERQTYPASRFEVIVVDDGSTDGTEHLTWNTLPFRVRYYRQENAGAGEARNTGACQSSAEILLFMDDDIVATPGMLENLIQTISVTDQVIVLGTLIPTSDDTTSSFAAMYSSGEIFPGDVDDVKPAVDRARESDYAGCFVHFSKCMTGVLGIRRQDFYALEMFQDPTGGWPNWDDVDFGYRAHLRGFRLWRSYGAIALHFDYSIKSLEANCARLERISKSAAQLFARYPEILEYTAYRDKGPISFLSDHPTLLIRKFLRSLVSNPACVLVMRQFTRVLEKHHPRSLMLALLYRWLLSASMYKGYRCGLCELTESCA
jgi:glycosyltransferase involved in cell wall biosynthesis